MISWIQKYFQQHFRTIFAVLLALIIVSFVFTIGASGGIGHAERGAIERPFFGANLASAADAQRVSGDAQLSVFISYGMANVDNEQLQQYALQRFAAIALANRLHIPAPTDVELKQHLRGLRAFQGQNGEFDPTLYTKFRDSLKTNNRLRESEVFRVLADDYRAELIQKLFAGPGYVLSSDVRKQLAAADTQWALAIASIPADSYNPSITPSQADLAKFYADNKFRYEIPPAFSGYAIHFDTAAYLPKVKVTDDDVRNYYNRHKARFTPAPKDPKATPDEAAGFEAVKASVETALRQERANRLAVNDAADFTIQLDDKKATPSSLPDLAGARGLALKPLKPFTRGQAIAELGGATDLSNEAFKLSQDRFFSDALTVPTGAVILVWKETIPSRAPELNEVLSKVTVDYLATERRTRFVELGKTLRSGIEARLKSGQNFGPAAEAAASAAGVKVELRTPAAFTLRQPPRDLPYSVFGTLESLEKGKVSDMVIADEKGLIVFAAEKNLPAMDDNAPAFIEARTQLARMSGSTTGGAVMSELVERELKASTPAQP
jgi:peptidyl-prolyl cis-trans isomerase D